MPRKVNLKSLSKDELSALFRELGLPRYRADQLLHRIYQKYAADLSEITEFSLDLRGRLSERAYVGSLKPAKRVQSADGTEKYLFELHDGETIESVLIPGEDRLTLCISSQVGCAMGCTFCLTGSLGLVRNLEVYEIIDQVLAVNRMIGPSRKVTNIVLMGMGEPLANLDNVAEALWRFTTLLGISKRRITLSTSGLVPKIGLLPVKAPEVNLAVSLNAATDSVRDSIMPVNKKYPIRTLLEACRRFPLSPGRRITFEYVLIGGLNDSPEDARRLAGLMKGLRGKINLIPLNPHPATGMKRPTEETVLAFENILVRQGLTVMIRDSKGQDILAACGQLKASH